MKKKGIGEKPHLKKNRVSPGFDRVVAPASLLANLDRSSHQVDPPGRFRFNNYA